MSYATPVNALNLEKTAQRSFIKFFNGLDEKPKTTIRFFNRVDYYSVHGRDDAETVAKIIHHSTANIKQMAPGEIEPVIYITLSKGEFERAARELLLVKNYRVEVYTKEKADKQSEWTLEYKGSPGNLIQFEDVIFNKNDMVTGASMISVVLRNEGKQKMVGLACIDCTDFVMSLTEFADDDFFAELEATIVLLNPRECIVPTFDGEYEKVKNLMDRNSVMVTVRRKTDFCSPEADLIQDLNKLLRFEKGQQETAHTLPEVSNKFAMAALGAAIKYMNLLTDDSNFGQYSLRTLNLDRYVHLDAAAVKALNLFPKVSTNINSAAYRWQSVLGVLDRCRTPQGHRLMAQWVKQPLRNEETLRDRHTIVGCLLDSPSILQRIYDEQLKSIPDVLMLIKRLMRKKAALQDLYRIYQVIQRLSPIIQLLESLENTVVTNILSNALKDSIEELEMLNQMVLNVIDLQGLEKGEFHVKASFDPDLEEMTAKLDKLDAKMERLRDRANDELDVDTVKLEFVAHHGYHFRVTLKDEKEVRKNKKYKVVDVVKSGVRFTTEDLTEYSNKAVEIKESYEDQQQSIVNEIVKVAIGYIGPLTAMNFQLAQIDCLVSFAIAAKDAPIPYVRPKMLPEGSGVLELTELRHPCLELQDHVSFIANDISFKAGESTMYIITGPNMGGKSTLIRSVGTAVLMAHVGSFVPCGQATITMVDSILGRIGASDNTAKGLSTFMVEMVETAAIIRTATDKSLVIIDELGRGTSTYDGCGLAWAIAENLAKEIGCFTLFATHFHEIAELTKTTKTVKSCYMDAVVENGEFTLLYQLKPGVMQRSFGIQIAKMAKFPKHLVELAEATYEEYEDHTKNLTTEEEKELAKYIEEAVDKIYQNEAEMTDQEIEQLVEECRQKVKASNEGYFRETFPTLFENQMET